MAGLAFAVSPALLRALHRQLIAPLEEMHDAVTDFHLGDHRRRPARPPQLHRQPVCISFLTSTARVAR